MNQLRSSVSAERCYLRDVKIELENKVLTKVREGRSDLCHTRPPRSVEK